jgi:hypothetical protein
MRVLGRESSILSPRTIGAGLVLFCSSLHLVPAIAAQQSRGESSIQASHARNYGAKLKKDMESLAEFEGRWSCHGSFPASGKQIDSEIVFTPELEGAWLQVRHDDLLPNQFHAIELWGLDSGRKQFVALIFDNFGGMRKFTSTGWISDTLIWIGEPSTTAPFTTQRFVFSRPSPTQFTVNWEVKKGSADWRLGDTLTCRR